jgi:hypothetical protein
MPLIVVWFSCGVASAVAAKRTIELYSSSYEIRVVNNPVREEDEDNLRFKKDIEAWLGVPIETAINPKYPDCSAETVWRERRYMAGTSGAPCTVELKKLARQSWEALNLFNFDSENRLVMGFTVEERARHDRFVLTERQNLLPVLIDEGLTKERCHRIVVSAGIQPPAVYGEGYPNANCIGCVKATSPTYWNLVRRTRPDVFRSRAELSRELGARLVRVQGERIFLDELDPEAAGAPLKTMNAECGIFCEERGAVAWDDN